MKEPNDGTFKQLIGNILAYESLALIGDRHDFENAVYICTIRDSRKLCQQREDKTNDRRMMSEITEMML